jgi:hypothetical protein
MLEDPRALRTAERILRPAIALLVFVQKAVIDQSQPEGENASCG